MLNSLFKKENLPRVRLKGNSEPAAEPLIRLQQVTKVYKTGASSFTALKGINLSVGKGEFVAVIGKSGSGKSTLLNIVTGIDRPTTGEVIIENTAIHKLSEGRLAAWRGRTIGVIFQFFQLLPTLTVIENIMLPMDFCHMFSIRERRERAMHLLDQMELADQAYKLPANISGGQQQRVAIARALANDPPIIVADEPTGNLDSKTAQSIFQLFGNLVDQGKTILMVTHDQDLSNQTARTIFLKDGEILGDTRAGFLPEFWDTLGEPAGDGKPIPISMDENHTSIRAQIVEILAQPSTAVQYLQELLLKGSEDPDATVAIYQILMDEIERRAGEAERAGRPEVAKNYWKILADSTEPWSQRDVEENE